ncbi:MAG: hypothetical protein JXR37_10805 [Kiritimatiellae bacterium]|nr:hypothetical protein [Kiritimatiellia bacterium]
MKKHPRKMEPLPPRLSMDEYVTWIEESLRNADPRRVERQKAIEEQIKARFSLVEDNGTHPATPGSPDAAE